MARVSTRAICATPNLLSACLGSVFALSAPAAHAITVLSCTDNGVGDIGNLRNSIANAGDGATVDLTQLVCSEISLHQGQILISQNDLTIKGPGMASLGVSGIYNNARQHYRVLQHTGTGILAISDLRISDGYVSTNGTAASGGCVRSAGSVELDRVIVTNCIATSSGVGASIHADGGGIYATSGLKLSHSTISSCAAGQGGEVAFGGGFSVNGPLKMYDSSLVGNHAGGSGTYGYSGAGSVTGSAVISGSTISGNVATARTGGLGINGATVTISNSTISGNEAIAGTGGGLVIGSPDVHVNNSTVAFNKSGSISANAYLYAPGLAVFLPGAAAVSVTMQSSLFSNNSFGPAASQYDLSIKAGATVSGANNLVHITGSTVPNDTKIGTQGCPLLSPLRDNGGLTLTHALASNSPAIDAGNNSAGLVNDQRGSGFLRVLGPMADIGAYEIDRSEVILAAGFEGCPG